MLKEISVKQLVKLITKEKIKFTMFKPSLIHHDTIALVHIYSKESNFPDDLWTSDFDDWLNRERDRYAENADNFYQQFALHASPAFLIALRNRLQLYLEEHDKLYGTDFSKG